MHSFGSGWLCSVRQSSLRGRGSTSPEAGSCSGGRQVFRISIGPTVLQEVGTQAGLVTGQASLTAWSDNLSPPDEETASWVAGLRQELHAKSGSAKHGRTGRDWLCHDRKWLNLQPSFRETPQEVHARPVVMRFWLLAASTMLNGNTVAGSSSG